MIPQHGLFLLVRKCYDLPRYEFEQLLIIHSIQGGIFHIGQYKPDGSFFILRGNLREAYFLAILTYLVNVTVVSNLPGKRIERNDWISITHFSFSETLEEVPEAFTHNIVCYLILLSLPAGDVAGINPAAHLKR